ncbi:MAG: cyclopropane fatty acyl phospholipid synthase [Candidatus Omnitrophica bacterium]|nr:cyclopropane fatty acyl phospholipid synthase [Candidatus Omnitrophota bacterium]
MTQAVNPLKTYYAPRRRSNDFFLEKERQGVSWEEKKIKDLLDLSGVSVNGSKPSDIQVYDKRFYHRVVSEGSLGLGESYMDGWWDCPSLDGFFSKILSSGISRQVQPMWLELGKVLLAYLTNYPKSRAYDVGKVHYDLGNEFYQAMLGDSMVYSCGYWKEVDSLDAAQEAKFELVCRKLNLQKGQTILDIGLGWGSFAKFAAQHYGVRVEGITISHEQAEFSQKMCAGLPVTVKYQDYHDIDGTFDHIVSIGMFEHVGYKNYCDYMKIVHRCLADKGLFLLHTIGSLKSTVGTDPWMHKYIFPNSMIPSMERIARASAGLFVMEDVHNFGADYDKTLMAWYRNFQDNWPKFSKDYGDQFFRMWRYYLLMCAGLFRSRRNQVWQVVFSKQGVPGGYRSIR